MTCGFLLIAVACLPVVALWSAEREDLDWRDDVLAAQKAAGLAQKDFAYCLGISEAQVSDQLALRGHLSEWRMRKLPREFHVALYQRRLQRWGIRAVDDQTILRLIDAVQTLTGQMKKPMAKAELSAERQERAG